MTLAPVRALWPHRHVAGHRDGNRWEYRYLQRLITKPAWIAAGFMHQTWLCSSGEQQQPQRAWVLNRFRFSPDGIDYDYVREFIATVCSLCAKVHIYERPGRIASEARAAIQDKPTLPP
jgi:hypothetical protein